MNVPLPWNNVDFLVALGYSLLSCLFGLFFSPFLTAIPSVACFFAIYVYNSISIWTFSYSSTYNPIALIEKGCNRLGETKDLFYSPCLFNALKPYRLLSVVIAASKACTKHPLCFDKALIYNSAFLGDKHIVELEDFWGWEARWYAFHLYTNIGTGSKIKTASLSSKNGHQLEKARKNEKRARAVEGQFTRDLLFMQTEWKWVKPWKREEKRTGVTGRMFHISRKEKEKEKKKRK